MAARSEDMQKWQRKQNKKLSRIKDRLTNIENVVVCDEPTTIVCVHNGGLDNGVSQNDLYDLFAQHGHVQEVIMIPRKAYCFICYDTTDSAARAKESLTGHLLREGKDPSQNIILYVFFVASAPSCVSPSTQLPPGLLLFEDFISAETEQLLLRSINFEEQSASNTGQGSSLKHREVKHFGYEFKYSINNVDPNEPLPEGIPEQCHQLLQEAVDRKIVSHFPDQLTVNRYKPGQGIPPHVDTPSAFEDGIMSLSCGSQVIMDFRHADGCHLSVLVPPRSLLVMTGESRYVWSHGITPRKSDIVPSAAGGLTLVARGVRTSFTFRKLSATLGVPASKQQDSFSCLPKTDREACVLESRHVHTVYEEIADHFSATRHKPWPRIAEFLLAQQLGSILLDIGCGNGKYFDVNSHLCQIGSDRSENLASICGARGFQVFVADVLAIPVRSGCVDVCLCIAVIHHLSTQARRKQAIEELVRILRPGGCALIYVWAQEQQKDRQRSKYLKPNRERCQEPSEHTGNTEHHHESAKHVGNSEHHHELTKHENTEHHHESTKHENTEHHHEPTKPENTEHHCEPTKHENTEHHHEPTKHENTEHHQESTKHGENTEHHHKSLKEADSEQCEKEQPQTEKNELSDNLSSQNVTSCDNGRDLDAQPREDYKHDSSDLSSTRMENTQHVCGGSSNTVVKDLEHNCSDSPNTHTDRQFLQVHVNRTEFKAQDMLVPWKLKKTGSNDRQTAKGSCMETQTLHRFYHVFRQGELDALCTEVGGCAVTESYYDQGNWCVVLRKC